MMVESMVVLSTTILLL